MKKRLHEDMISIETIDPFEEEFNKEVKRRRRAKRRRGCILLLVFLIVVFSAAVFRYRYLWILPEETISNEELAALSDKEMQRVRDRYGARSIYEGGDYLTGRDKRIYDFLAAEIIKIAEGEEDQTVVKVPIPIILGNPEKATEKKLYYKKEAFAHQTIRDDTQVPETKLGEKAMVANRKISYNKKIRDELFDFDMKKIVDGLRFFAPFELYWYGNRWQLAIDDARWGFAGENICFDRENAFVSIKLFPSKGYRAAGESETSVDKAKVNRAIKARDNALRVVAAAEGKKDFAKLDFYRKYICENTYYDKTVLNNIENYGDPWQMINIFDMKFKPGSVCEGYAKAFKFLCDNSDFEKDINCYIVTGTFSEYKDRKNHQKNRHMWNVVDIDGKNMIADITGCDYIGGHNRLLFLTGAEPCGNFLRVKKSETVYEGSGGYIVRRQVDNCYRYRDSTKRFYRGSGILDIARQ